MSHVFCVFRSPFSVINTSVLAAGSAAIGLFPESAAKCETRRRHDAMYGRDAEIRLQGRNDDMDKYQD